MTASSDTGYSIEYNDGDKEDDVPSKLIRPRQYRQGTRRAAKGKTYRVDNSDGISEDDETDSDEDSSTQKRTTRSRDKSQKVSKPGRRDKDYDPENISASLHSAKSIAGPEGSKVQSVCNAVIASRWAKEKFIDLELARKLETVRTWDSNDEMEEDEDGICEVAEACLAAFTRFVQCTKRREPKDADIREFEAAQFKACHEAEKKARQLVRRLMVKLESQDPEDDDREIVRAYIMCCRMDCLVS